MRTLALAMLFAAVAACGNRGPSTDSKSNWLHDCSAHPDCGDGLSCICGVCTMACTGAPACDRSAVDAVCIDPARAGLPAACATQLEAVGTSVCLAVCSTSAQCGAAQVCVKGSCIAAAVATRAPEVDAGRIEGAGTGGPLDPKSPVPEDAGPPLVDAARPPMRVDGGFILQRDAAVGPFDGGGHSADGGGLADAAVNDCEGIENCCGLGQSCPVELICHVDRTCVPVGVADTDGVATLARASEMLLGADDEYVYGSSGDQRQLIRWPAAGGPQQVLADATLFFFGPEQHVLVDGDTLYFNTRTDYFDVYPTLFRASRDPGVAPLSFGSVGSQLTHDAQLLYFTDPDSKRVTGVRKDMLDVTSARQTVYESASAEPEAIAGLALNVASLFVLERATSGSVPFVVTQVDRTTLSHAPLERDAPSALSASAPSLFATDAYVVVSDYSGFERVDLATGEVTTWSVHVRAPIQVGGGVYFVSALATADAVIRLDIATGEQRTLLVTYEIAEVVASAGHVFATVLAEGSEWTLVRIDD